MLRVVLIDAELTQPLGVAELASEGLGQVEVLATLPSLADAERTLRELRPSVVLVDVLLPLGQQRDLVQKMGRELPSMFFIALAPADPPDDRVLFALRSGVLGFVERDASPTDFAEAIATVATGEPWLPNRAGSSVLVRAAQRLELTPRERTNRMGQILLGAIPIAAVLGAALGYMINSYWGAIGVRTEDLGVGASDRLVDVVFLLLLAAGAFGPLVFVPAWSRVIHERLAQSGLLPRLPAAATIFALAVLVLAAAAVLVAVAPVFVSLVLGPLVAGVVVANAIGFSDQLPSRLALEWTEARRAAAIAAGLAIALLLALGVELARGPDIRDDGLHGFLAPEIMGDDVAPVRLIGTGENAVELEAIMLGAAGSRFVLYDPCVEVVLHVPASTVTAEVIDAVTC